MKKIKNLADLRLRKSELALQQKNLEKNIQDRWTSVKQDMLHPDHHRRDEKNGNGRFEHVFESVMAVAGEAVAKKLAHRVSQYFFT